MDARYTIDRSGFLHNDGTLKIHKWSTNRGIDDDGNQLLTINLSRRQHSMAHSPATGEATVSNGQIGADIIRLKAGDGFVPHTHAGDHLLVVIGGRGTITYNGKIYPTEAGQMYLIEGEVPHAVGALTDHVILAVGSPHKPVDSLDRMVPVEYETVLAELNELHCLICDLKASRPRRLHEIGCEHCPCIQCNPVDEEPRKNEPAERVLSEALAK
jgi:quercetin dioxygenase-like cupin family protein